MNLALNMMTNKNHTMKTLTIEHLDFSNNGKARLTRLPHWDFEYVDLNNCELAFNSTSKEPYLRHRNVTFGLDQIKPYKRPLSQLNETIEHNGEKFVPIEWFEIGDDGNDSVDYGQGNVRLIGLLKDMAKHNFIDLPYMNYGVVHTLHSWHFDTFGLIEAGLAIPIPSIP